MIARRTAPPARVPTRWSTLTDAGGGVTLNAGAELKVNADRWRANGGYQCTSDGFIRFTIGDESLTVPVNCV
jgi:hypothetical protein